MEAIHKFNDGNGATLCNGCYTILYVGHNNELMCEECNELFRELSLQFDSEHRCLKALKDINRKKNK